MSPEARTLKGLRVLLVEDVGDIRDVFTILLRAEGAQVMAAASGSEAMSLLEGQDFDAVLTDLGLPDIAGDALIRHIRAATRGRVRVVVITGYSEPYLSRARQAGADAVFTKPVDWSLILDYLRRPGLAASA